MAVIFYFGTECVTCHKIEPSLDRIAKEHGITLVKKECYHNAANQEELFKNAEGKCQELPFVYNTETDTYLCGDVSDEEIETFFT